MKPALRRPRGTPDSDVMRRAGSHDGSPWRLLEASSARIPAAPARPPPAISSLLIPVPARGNLGPAPAPARRARRAGRAAPPRVAMRFASAPLHPIGRRRVERGALPPRVRRVSMRCVARPVNVPTRSPALLLASPPPPTLAPPATRPLRRECSFSCRSPTHCLGVAAGRRRGPLGGKASPVLTLPVKLVIGFQV